MNEYAKEILELAKMTSTDYVTGSRRVTAKPCWVFNVIIDPTDATLVTQGYLRNGETLASDILVGFGSQFTHNTHIGHFPMYFNRGLFVELNTNIDGITIQYLPD